MNGDEKHWRVFCAVEVPPDVGEKVTAYIEDLRSRFPGAKVSWTRAGKFHLTLKFFGAVAPARVADISQAAQRAVTALPAFDLTVGGAGTFPARGPARVLWIGIKDCSGSLTQLQQRLDNECKREGFEKEHRNFHPHLTLARIRHPQTAHDLAGAHTPGNFSQEQFNVIELLVIRSQLSPKGSQYSTISRHPLSQS